VIEPAHTATQLEANLLDILIGALACWDVTQSQLAQADKQQQLEPQAVQDWVPRWGYLDSAGS